MKQCLHPYIVKFYGSFECKNFLWVIMEYCRGGSIGDVLSICKRKLNENQISAIIAGALRGLVHLHKKGIIHRDVKAANILLCHNAAKLGDFGTSVKLSQSNRKLRSLEGSSYWLAPEMITVDTGYDVKVDIWALGITAIEMAQGKPPHHDIHHAQVMYIIPEAPSPELDRKEGWSAEFHDFVSVCLQKRPEDRPSASELLLHPFIKGGIYRTNELRKLVEECHSILEDFRYEADLDSGNWLRKSEFSGSSEFADDLEFIE